jgi:DNA primase large subunit
MSLSDIANDIKSTVEQGQAWLAKTVEEHVPALLAEAQKIEASPIYQAIAGAVLPAAVEQEIAKVITTFIAALAAREPAAPADPAAPAAPAENGPGGF